MNAWWSSRTPRERLLLTLAAGLAVIVCYWLGLLQPLSRAADAAAERHAAAELDAKLMEAAAARISAEPLTAASRNVRSDVTEAAASSGLTLSRLQPEADGGLTVWIEPAAPGAVFGCIARLAAERGVEVVRITIEKVADGRVQTQATFASAAS